VPVTARSAPRRLEQLAPEERERDGGGPARGRSGAAMEGRTCSPGKKAARLSLIVPAPAAASSSSPRRPPCSRRLPRPLAPPPALGEERPTSSPARSTPKLLEQLAPERERERGGQSCSRQRRGGGAMWATESFFFTIAGDGWCWRRCSTMQIPRGCAMGRGQPQIAAVIAQSAGA
jgi:hypothetical protein